MSLCSPGYVYFRRFRMASDRHVTNETEGPPGCCYLIEHFRAPLADEAGDSFHTCHTLTQYYRIHGSAY